jgi:hypothetical protein
MPTKKQLEQKLLNEIQHFKFLIKLSLATINKMKENAYIFINKNLKT